MTSDKLIITQYLPFHNIVELDLYLINFPVSLSR